MIPRGGAWLLPLVVTWAAACTAENPMYMMPAPCRAGERSCVTAAARSYPVVCGENLDGQLGLQEETCPPSAPCRDGLCSVPEGAKACVRQRDCDKGFVCVPLVGADRKLQLVCVPQAQTAAAPGKPCAQDADCQSYFCLPFSNGNYCLRACRTPFDCEANEDCPSLKHSVTVVQGAIQSCAPLRR